MIATMLVSAVLSAPVPTDVLMLQDTLDRYYDNPFIELYNCPIPSVDYYGVCEMEWLTEDPLYMDGWFVIGDSLVSRELDPSKFLFMPTNGEVAVEAVAWLASLQYIDCELISVDAMHSSSGYTISVSLIVYHSPPMMGDADSSVVELLYVVIGDRWHLEDPDGEIIP